MEHKCYEVFVKGLFLSDMVTCIIIIIMPIVLDVYKSKIRTVWVKIPHPTQISYITLVIHLTATFFT